MSEHTKEHKFKRIPWDNTHIRYCADCFELTYDISKNGIKNPHFKLKEK